MRRCSDPTESAWGLKNTCPENGAEPSAAAPVPLGPMTDGFTKYGPLPVMNKPVIDWSWLRLSVVSTVFSPDRALRLSVPRAERIEIGAPDCEVTKPLVFQPLSSLSSGA